MNEGKNGPFPSAKVENSYQKKDSDEWEPTNNFSTKEIAALAVMANAAAGKCLEIEAEQGVQEREDEGLEEAA